MDMAMCHARMNAETCAFGDCRKTNNKVPLSYAKGANMRVVIKIGTSTLTHKTGNLNIRRVEDLCKVISDIKNAGHEIIMVSSGAIGMGVGKLGLLKRPEDIPSKQAVAAVGQCELMYIYDKLFTTYHHTVAQILITGSDIENENSCHNFSNTVEKLLEYGALPIINENDTIATDEISISDNDTLAAVVSRSIRADMLILLSDIDGLYTSDPHKDSSAKLISVVPEITEEIRALAGGKGSALGTGGMVTKLNAAEICTKSGCTMVISNGSIPEKLYEIIEGGDVGTKFLPGK